MDIGFYFLVFILGIGTSFFSSFMTGGLGIFSITALVSIGLSPLMALGTMRLGSIGFMVGGIYQYFKANKIVWELVLPYVILGAVGAVIGAQIILSINEALLERILGFAILLFIPISIWKPKLGIQQRAVSTVERLYGYITYFLASVWGGSITVGTGFLLVYTQMHYFGRTLLEIKGTLRIPGLVKNVFVLGIFAYNSLVNWEIGIVFALGMLIGSLIGTKYAILLGDVWLRRILLITIGLFSVKLILGF